MLDVTRGLVLRLESDAGVATQNGAVTAWADQSGRGNDLSGVGNASFGAVMAPSGIPVILFDGDGDKLERNLALSGLPTGNRDRTIFFVADYDDPQSVTAGAVFGKDANGQAFGVSVLPDGALTVNGGGPGNDVTAAVDGVEGGFIVQSAVLEAGVVRQYLNGELIAAEAQAFSTQLQRLAIAEEIGGAGVSAMKVGALLVFDRALSDRERGQVEAYLHEKYFVPSKTSVVAVGDVAEVRPGGAVDIDVLANDLDDAPLKGARVNIVDQPEHGTITEVDAKTGVITYAQDGTGIADSFTYTVTDSDGAVSEPTAVSLAAAVGPLSLNGFTDELVLTRAQTGNASFQPISMTFLPDNRMLLLSKTGEIRIVDPESGANSVLMKVVNIDSGQERGLLDITLDPNFEQNGHFYLYYTPASPQHARISRFTFNEKSGGLTSTASVASEVVIWQDTDGYLACCHYGGGLDFGVDGKLWLTASDKFQASTPGESLAGGTPAGTDLMLNLASSTGKIIRINKDGSIPNGNDGWAANPFIDGTGGNDDSVWAFGLRNPFRARWDAEYGQMYIAEVGGNRQTLAHEDLHLASLDQPGAFYGWPFYEGTPNTYVNSNRSTYNPANFPQPDDDLADPGSGDFFSNPIWSMAHNGSGASITGGEVYRGDLFPTEWDGVYFYGDYTRDYIRYLVLDETGTEVLGDFAFKPSAQLPGTTNEVVSIAVGEDGALYYAMIASGEIRRVVYGTNDAPVIAGTNVSPLQGSVPLAITFTATVSDPNGDSMTYTVSFGDGTVVSGSVAPNGQISLPHTYTIDGPFSVSLSVTDGMRTTLSQPVRVEVGDFNDPPVITSQQVDLPIGDPGDLVTFSAMATDADNDSLTYTWYFGDGGSAAGVVGPDGRVIASHSYSADGTYLAYLEVSDGLATTASGQVTVQMGTPTQVPVTNGLVLLLESDIKIGLSEGTTVSAWLDGSGQGNNLFAQGDPQLLTNQTPTGKSAIVFDGTGDLLQRVNATDTIFNLPTGSANRSIFVVVDYVNPEGVWSGVVYGDGASNEAFGLVANNSGVLSVQGYGSKNDFPSGQNGVSGGFLVQSAVLNGNTVTHYRDGAQIDSDTHTFSTDLKKLVLGAEISGLGESQLKLGAVLIYNRAVTNNERLQIEDFLRTKYISAASSQVPPNANNDSATTSQGTAVTIDVLANDSDANNDPLTITAVSIPSNGTAVINNNGTPTNPADDKIIYTPSAGFTGSSSFTYTISDGKGGTDTATVSVSVTAPSTPIPVTSGLVAAYEAGQNVSLGSGSTVQGWLDGSGFGNDLTAAGNPTLVTGKTPTGQPAIVFDGTADLLQRVNATDTLNGFAAGGANRTIFMVVDYVAPEGVSSGVVYGDGASNEAFGLVANQNGILSVQGWGKGRDFPSGVNGVTGGFMVQSVVLQSNVTSHYKNGVLIDSDLNTFNTDLKKLVLGAEIAGLGESQMAIGAALIYNRALSTTERTQVENYLQAKYLSGSAPANNPPDAIDDQFIFIEDTPLSGNVLVNNGGGADTDPDGDPLTVSLVTNVANGSLVLSSNGGFSYTPKLDFNGNDSFVYRVSDGKGGTDTATVTLTGTPVNDPARAVNDSYTTTANVTLTVSAANGVLANDSDPEGDPFTAQLKTSVSNGALSLASNGSFSYTPNAGFSGVDSFTYQVTGGSSATVTINVGAGSGPVTAGLVARYESDASVSIGAGNVVTAWADASGQGNHLSAAGDPTLISGATPTGKSAIAFDGTGDLLQRVNATDTLNGFAAGAANRTIFVVVDYVAPEGVHSGIVYGDGAPNEAFGLVANNKGILSVQGWGKGNDFPSGVNGVTGGFMVQSVVLQSNVTSHYKNGALTDSDAHTFNTDLKKLVLGAEIAGLGESQLAIGAALIYNRALAQSERLQVEDYLQTKYIDDTLV